MKAFNLPEDIPAGDSDSSNIIFHNYSATGSNYHGKSVLNMNVISLVIMGEKTMHFAEKLVNLKDDEFHFLSTGNCLVSMKLSGNIQFKSILIFFDDRVLTDFYLKYNTKISSVNTNQNIHPEPYLSFKKDPFIVNFISSMHLLFQNNYSFSKEMKQLKFEELMLHILEKHPHQVLSFQAVKNKDFNDLEIRKTVEANITNNITIEELAFLCNTSLSTFKRQFEKIYHMPPNKWMLQKRMEIAKNLLLHYGQKPGEVYHKVGYENHSSFSQTFKQTFGVTPKKFQLQQLNETQ